RKTNLYEKGKVEKQSLHLFIQLLTILITKTPYGGQTSTGKALRRKNKRLLKQERYKHYSIIGKRRKKMVWKQLEMRRSHLIKERCQLDRLISILSLAQVAVKH